MGDLPKELKEEGKKTSKLVADLLGAVDIANGNKKLVFQGMVMGGGLTIPAVQRLAADDTFVGEAFRIQLRAFMPGGLKDGDIEKFIKKPKDNEDLAKKIAGDKGFYDIIAVGMGNERVWAARYSALEENREKHMTEEYEKLIKDGKKPDEAVKAIVASNKKLADASKKEFNRMKLIIERNALLGAESSRTLNAADEKQLVTLNKQIYALESAMGVYKAQKEEGKPYPKDEADYLYGMGSKKYRKDNPKKDDKEKSEEKSDKKEPESMSMKENTGGMALALAQAMGMPVNAGKLAAPGYTGAPRTPDASPEANYTLAV